jgi:glycosyltransferase involved in cell wall biosynthesis
LIARHLHKHSNIPWVADFRDPWIGNFNLCFPSPLHHRLVESKERQIIQDANHILVTSAPIGKSFCERIPGISQAKITWLPNGFDAQDFSTVLPAKRVNDYFYLVYTGSFYNRELTAYPILRAIQTALLTGQIPRQHLRVQLVGNTGKATQKWISELNLDGIVETPGFVPHEQSLAYLLAADALLLIIGVSPDSSDVYTGKIFEYLAAGKPILCLANDGVASDLVRRARAGIIVPPDDVPQISHRLVEMYQRWQNGQLSIEPERELIQTFERRQLTRRLAIIFDELTGKTV